MVVIELMGLPNAGKTESSRELIRRLIALKLRAKWIQDRVWDAPYSPDDDEYRKNLWAVREIGNSIEEARTQNFDVVLVERGAWAIIASVQAHLSVNNNGGSNKNRKNAQRALKLARDLVNDEDFFILIEISPGISMKRHKQLKKQPGKIINRKFLSILQKEYVDVKTRLPKTKSIVINGTNDFSLNQDRLVQIIQNLVQKKKGHEANPD